MINNESLNYLCLPVFCWMTLPQGVVTVFEAYYNLP